MTTIVHNVMREEAEAMAINALGFIASDPKLLPRFLAITGIEAGQIREAAGESGFLAGVLDFILAHEPTLLQFAEAGGVNPAAVPAARRALSTDRDPYEAGS